MTLTKILTAAVFVSACVAAAGSAQARKSTSAETIGEAMHTARVERGYVCYTDHYHYGSSGNQPSRRAAEASAISSWSSFVDLEYGSAWAIFHKAGSKKMSCTNGSGGWDCTVEARPCRS